MFFKNQKIGNSYVLNPGSTSFSRGPEGNGFGILTINNGKFISFEFKSC